MKRIRSFFVVILLTVPIRCRADIGPAPGSGLMAPSFARADVVCAGNVTGIRLSPGRAVPAVRNKLPINKINGVFVLSVARCYKGSAQSAEVSFVTHEPPELSTDVSVVIGEDLLVLLKRSDAGMFVLVDPNWGKWDARLVTFARPEGDGLQQLERDLVLNVDREKSTTSQLSNLRILHSLDTVSDGTINSLRRLFASPDSNVTLEAFAVAMKAGQASDVTAFERYLESNTQLTEQMLQQHDFSSIERLTDRGALEALEGLARMPFTALRYSAMAGIRHLRDPASVPELVKYLDGADPMMEYLALITLAEITGRLGEDAPSMQTFDGNREKYIASWRQWWVDAGKAQYEPR